MLNKVQLIGYVGKKPEVRTVEGGSSGKVANFRLATSEWWKDKHTGERKSRTEWHSIVVWGDDIVSKLVMPFIDKGSKIYVEGMLRTREWEKDGDKRYTTEVVIQGNGGTITLLDKQDSDRPPAATEEPEGPYSSSNSRAGGQTQSRIDHQAPLGYQPPAGNSGRPSGNVANGQHSQPKRVDDEIPF